MLTVGIYYKNNKCINQNYKIILYISIEKKPKNKLFMKNKTCIIFKFEFDICI